MSDETPLDTPILDAPVDVTPILDTEGFAIGSTENILGLKKGQSVEVLALNGGDRLFSVMNGGISTYLINMTSAELLGDVPALLRRKYDQLLKG